MNHMTASECPSEFTLDDHELHAGGSPDLVRHLADCADCQTRRAQRAAAQADFERGAAALWTRIATQGRERRRRARWWPPVVSLLAVAGAVVLWFGPRLVAPGGERYLGPKGRTPVEIVCRRGDAIFRLAPGDGVAPGDELRFRPLPVWSEARFIQIGSVDGTGRYTSFYPPGRDAPSVRVPDDASALEGSIRLDAAPGPERLFVVLSPAPVSETAVRQAAEANAMTSATVERLEGIPVQGTWVVLPKPAPPRAEPRTP
jgi:hypothetical protein